MAPRRPVTIDAILNAGTAAVATSDEQTVAFLNCIETAAASLLGDGSDIAAEAGGARARMKGNAERERTRDAWGNKVMRQDSAGRGLAPPLQ